MEELETVLALGSGGSSKIMFHEENRMERVENVKNVEQYIERIDEMIRRKQKFLPDTKLLYAQKSNGTEVPRRKEV